MSDQVIKDVSFGTLHAHLLHPGPKARAGVLVLSSRDGLGGPLDRVLTGLADEGFVALAWDPYTAYGTVTAEDKARISQKEMRDDVVEIEHVRCLDYMQDDLHLGRIGVIGFCMGGRMAMILAADDARVRAVSAYYPTLRMPMPANVKDLISLAPKIACPVEVHYPERDILTTKETFWRLRTALESRSVHATTSSFFHPDATHSFFPQLHEPGSADSIASSIAWPATLAFFRAALRET
jgi:carboxymethylenebutenolidase